MKGKNSSLKFSRSSRTWRKTESGCSQVLDSLYRAKPQLVSITKTTKTLQSSSSSRTPSLRKVSRQVVLSAKTITSRTQSYSLSSSVLRTEWCGKFWKRMGLRKRKATSGTFCGALRLAKTINSKGLMSTKK